MGDGGPRGTGLRGPEHSDSRGPWAESLRLAGWEAAGAGAALGGGEGLAALQGACSWTGSDRPRFVPSSSCCAGVGPGVRRELGWTVIQERGSRSRGSGGVGQSQLWLMAWVCDGGRSQGGGGGVWEMKLRVLCWTGQLEEGTEGTDRPQDTQAGTREGAQAAAHELGP